MRKIYVRTATDCLKVLKEIYKNDTDILNKYKETLDECKDNKDRVDLSDERLIEASKTFVNELCDRLYYDEKPLYDIIYRIHKVCNTMTRLYKYVGLPNEFSYTLSKPITIY
mgnify:CR=1 FL=1